MSSVCKKTLAKSLSVSKKVVLARRIVYYYKVYKVMAFLLLSNIFILENA